MCMSFYDVDCCGLSYVKKCHTLRTISTSLLLKCFFPPFKCISLNVEFMDFWLELTFWKYFRNAHVPRLTRSASLIHQIYVHTPACNLYPSWSSFSFGSFQCYDDDDDYNKFSRTENDFSSRDTLIQTVHRISDFDQYNHISTRSKAGAFHL